MHTSEQLSTPGRSSIQLPPFLLSTLGIDGTQPSRTSKIAGRKRQVLWEYKIPLLSGQRGGSLLSASSSHCRFSSRKNGQRLRTCCNTDWNQPVSRRNRLRKHIFGPQSLTTSVCMGINPTSYMSNRLSSTSSPSESADLNNSNLSLPATEQAEPLPASSHSSTEPPRARTVTPRSVSPPTIFVTNSSSPTPPSTSQSPEPARKRSGSPNPSTNGAESTPLLQATQPGDSSTDTPAMSSASSSPSNTSTSGSNSGSNQLPYAPFPYPMPANTRGSGQQGK